MIIYTKHMNIITVAALQIAPKGQDEQYIAAWWLAVLIVKYDICMFSLCCLNLIFFFKVCLTQYLQLLNSYSTSNKVINIASFKEKQHIIVQ